MRRGRDTGCTKRRSSRRGGRISQRACRPRLLAAVFAADAELDAGAGLVALRSGNLDELADAGLVN